jgi:hypothetical protein
MSRNQGRMLEFGKGRHRADADVSSIGTQSEAIERATDVSQAHQPDRFEYLSLHH